jgi:hypothetical protein
MCGIWGSTVGEAGVEARLSKVSVAGCCSARTHRRAVVGGKVRPRGRIRRHESGGSERDLVGTMRSLLLRSPRRGLRAPLRSSAALPCNGYPRHPEVGMCGRRTIDGCRRSVAVGTSEAGLRCCEGRVEDPSLEDKIEGSEGTERPDFSPFQIEPSKSSDVIPPPLAPRWTAQASHENMGIITLDARFCAFPLKLPPFTLWPRRSLDNQVDHQRECEWVSHSSAVGREAGVLNGLEVSHGFGSSAQEHTTCKATHSHNSDRQWVQLLLPTLISTWFLWMYIDLPSTPRFVFLCKVNAQEFPTAERALGQKSAPSGLDWFKFALSMQSHDQALRQHIRPLHFWDAFSLH